MSDSSANRRRVVVTGIGAVTNLGLDATSTWDAMVQGRSGASLIRGEIFERWGSDWTVRIGGQIHDFEPTPIIDARDVKKLDRVAHLGISAAVEAVRQSGIDFSKEDPERCGVVIGSGVGGIETIEMGKGLLDEKGPRRLSPFTVPKLMVNTVAGNVSIRWGLQGPSSAHATACASAGHSIADATRLIEEGEADVVIAGGSEAAVTPICVAAFSAMRAMTTRNDEPQKASRPFDKDRDGFLLAEGAGILVLESEEHARARGADILCTLAGYATTSDAAHITAPDQNGKGAMRSMRNALRRAGIAPETVDYVNAHGTSTPLGDSAEVAAVGHVFGEHAAKSKGGKLLMSSTKSMHGHALGASGGVEMVACVGAIRHGVVPPTINLDNPDEGFDMDFVAHTARDRRVRCAINNTFGFGGHNVTLVVTAYEG